MTKQETLDQKLRKRAKENLMERLNHAAQPLRKALQMGNPTYVTVNDKETSCSGLINDIVNAIFDRKIKRAEEKEIDDFIKQVDSLDQQIDELKSELD